MKRIRKLLFIIILIVGMGVTEQVRGSERVFQQPVATLEWLTIDLWPDYDRSSVLVLITGSVQAGAPLPAQITLPVPQNATLNAVARISDEQEMIDDIAYEQGEGTLTLTTPDMRFRVEYYMPYAADGLQRQFSYSWPGGPAVGQMDLSVQQPLAATSLTIQPEPETVITGTDGLQYHNLPVRALQVAETFNVDVTYAMSNNQLTAASAAPVAPQNDQSATTAAGAVDWPLILAAVGGVLLLAAVGWQLFGGRLRGDRGNNAPRKPRPTRSSAAKMGAAARFCHQCGNEARSGDRFCRVCGTQLKSS